MTAFLIAVAGMMIFSAWLGVRGHRSWRRSELFRKAFSASPTAIAVIRTADGRFLEANESYERLLQYSRAELVGHTDEELGIWDSAADHEAALQALARDGRLRDRPAVLKRRDGTRLHVVYSAERVEIDGQDARLAMLRDVSEQVRSDELKARVEAQMQQTRRLESIGLLAGGIAHDFNNVLQAVKGYTELAVDGLPVDHPVRVPLAQVSEAADRAAGFTAKLLTFSRRDAPKTERLALSRIVADTGVLLRRAIGGPIKVVTIDGTDLPGIDGDRAQIEQILMTLCLNARDAMPNGGTLTIETGRAAFTVDDVRDRPWAKAGSWVFLRVADTGTGIAADVRPHIFEPFFTTKPVGEGSGLGLSAAYAIVERHGGLISVETTPGAGSTFTVYFPSAGQAAAAPASGAGTAAAIRGRGETILLAEDEPFVRDLAVEMLEAASYRVLVARDGAEAEAIVLERAAELHAAVLDIVMPVRNGRQVYDTLLRVRPEVPVIFCSGYTFGELSDVDRLPGSAILPKPYSRASLLAAVRSAIDSKAQSPT